MAKQSSSSGEWVVLADGEFYTIAAVVVGGRCEAEDFLAQMPTRDRAQMDQLLDRLAKTGALRNPQEFRGLKDGRAPKVFEVKAHRGPGYRLYMVQSGRHYLATHGSKKPKDNQVREHTQKARRLFNDWQEGL